MKKISILTFLSLFMLTGCNNASTNTTMSPNDQSINNKKITSEETPIKKTNKLCDWIDGSDVVIKLDLPEKYAHYNDKTIFPSYETGFMFKSSYGDIASSRKLARKNCDYRVGFSKEDFANINLNPNYPLVILVNKDSSTDFTYDDEPKKITLKNNLPEQGNKFIIKINGEVTSFDHYDAIFK